MRKSIDYEELGDYAPDWATCWAMDEDGEIWLYRDVPSRSRSSTMWAATGDKVCVGVGGISITNRPADWTQSLRHIKKPWHWPAPDENTPVDAKVYVRSKVNEKWRRRYYCCDGRCFDKGATQWSTEEELDRVGWNQTVLAKPDDIEEYPPADLEVRK